MPIKDYSMPMDVNDIMECIPHRYPFLLIDRILEVTPNERIVAIKNISYSDPYLQGHFPGNPLVPGVLLVEGMAQASAVLGHLSTENGLKTCYLTEINSSRFRKPVVPGDRLRIELSVLRKRLPFFWFDAQAYADTEVVAEVKFSALMKQNDS